MRSDDSALDDDDLDVVVGGLARAFLDVPLSNPVPRPADPTELDR